MRLFVNFRKGFGGMGNVPFGVGCSPFLQTPIKLKKKKKEKGFCDKNVSKTYYDTIKYSKKLKESCHLKTSPVTSCRLLPLSGSCRQMGRPIVVNNNKDPLSFPVQNGEVRFALW